MLIRLLLVLLTSNSLSAHAGMDRWMAPEVQGVKEQLSDTAFAELPNPLLQFLVLEKRHLYTVQTKRLVIDTTGKPMSGIVEPPFEMPGGLSHPSSFVPLRLKGVWLPEKSAKMLSLAFSANESGPYQSFFRRGNSGREFLFVIHPDSQALFPNILREENFEKVEIQALALSSVRSLLIALPSGGRSDQWQGKGWNYQMVKVSLDRKLRGTLRVLSAKETAASVAATQLLRKHGSIRIMEDIISFLPTTEPQPSGMLVRAIPEFLLDESSEVRAVPFFALLGPTNRGLLDQIILDSRLSISEFIGERILRPYAKVIVDLVFRKHISLEAHAQNLLLLLQESTAQPVHGSEFMYRDMGGVSALPSEEDLSEFPNGLGKKEYFYSDAFSRDSGAALEDHFVNGILFLLTKQFTQMDPTGDPSFAAWKAEMLRLQKLGNFHSQNEMSHEEFIPLPHFIQYGYFEQCFGRVLIEELRNGGILRAIPASKKNQGEWIVAEFLNHLQSNIPVQAFNSLIQGLFGLVDSKLL